MEIQSWLLFCSIAFLATLSPGPAVLLVSTHSLQYGPVRALFTIAGNISGLFIMSGCSVLGLNTLIVYSATGFSIVKLIGAMYLVYIGLRLWRKGICLNDGRPGSVEKISPFKMYTQGSVVALTNPKAIAFTTALFPQFIDLSAPLTSQFVILALTFMFLSASCLFVYALVSHKAKEFSKNCFSGKIMGRIFGTFFIGAGATLVTTVHN